MSARRPPGLGRLFAALFAGAVAVALPSVAGAQTVALTQGAVVQDQFPNGSPSGHPNNVDATWISYADCENNINVVVPLTLTPGTNGTFASLSLQAWATSVSGTDCGQIASRNTTNGVCWPVLPSGIVPAISVTVPIRVQDLLQYLGSTSGGKPVTYAAGTEAACHVVQSSGAIPLSLQFIWFDPGGNELNSLSVALNAEMIGPAPPSNLTAGQGDGLLILNWTPQSDPNTRGFSIFIDPLPGQEGQVSDASGGGVITDASCQVVQVCPDTGAPFVFDASGEAGDGASEASAPVDSGMATDAGCVMQTVCGEAGATQTGGGSCPSSILVSGVTSEMMSTTPVTTDEAGNTLSEGGASVTVTGTAPSAAALMHVIQNIGDGTATNATITGLKNGVTYTIAISAVDNLGDNGPLSTPVCTDPTPVDDFWKQYIAAGGQAGGGFCALEGVGMPGGAVVFALTMLGTAITWRRRRKGR